MIDREEGGMAIDHEEGERGCRLQGRGRAMIDCDGN